MRNYPAQGWGAQSPYYDDDLLFEGTYQVISVTLDKDSRDAENTPDTTLRAGLLLAKRTDGKYEPVSTVDGYLNGDTPTQRIHDVVVLGREYEMTTNVVKGVNKVMEASDLIVPAYWSCNLRSVRCYYNNKSILAITSAQFAKMVGRINIIPASMRKFTDYYGELRVLVGVQNVATI